MARAGGIVRSATRALQQITAQARDPEAATIAAEVYAAVVESRGEVGAAPLWAVGPFIFVAREATEVVMKAHKLPKEDYELVAAYVVSVLSDVFTGLIGSFDRAHFERWRDGGFAPSEDASSVPD